jgi:hypothetical protein
MGKQSGGYRMAQLRVMLITPTPLPGPQQTMLGGVTYFIRSEVTDDVKVDFVFLPKGCSEEQIQCALRCGKVRFITLNKTKQWLKALGHPGGKDAN